MFFQHFLFLLPGKDVPFCPPVRLIGPLVSGGEGFDLFLQVDLGLDEVVEFRLPLL